MTPRTRKRPEPAGEVLSPDGVPIRYRADGSGSPPLVFVHCWCGDGSHWEGQLRHFAPRHRVVAVDLAGHGRSGSDRTRWTVDAFGQDVVAVVAALDLRDVVLVGHSMSGAVTLEAARIMPDRVAALVPIDTLHNAEFRPAPSEIDAWIAPFEADFRRATKAYIRRLFPARSEAALAERISDDLAAAPPGIAVASLRALFAYDLPRALSVVQAPIRCINSDLFPTLLEINRRHAPRFDAVIMRGVGHFPMLEAPEEFNRLLEQAVRDLVPAGGDRRGSRAAGARPR